MADGAKRTGTDLARQVVNVVGAVLQVGAGAWSGSRVGEIANEFRTAILPAGYAFAIWSLIFALLGAYAVWQALPAQRTDPVYRRIGWFTAAAMVGNGVWTFVFSARQFLVAQAIILAIAVCAGVAFFRFLGALGGRRVAGFQVWIVGPGLGLLFGWITAASVVGLAQTLATLGLDTDGVNASVGGSALLLAGGFVAFLVLLFARGSGPATAWIAYGAAVIWALVAVAVNQYQTHAISAFAAVATGVLVLIALFGPFTLRPSGGATSAVGSA